MRRIGLSLFSCMALVVFMGLSAPAFATHDSACDQYGNQFGLYDVSIDTPDSHQAHAASGVTGEGLACGTEISWPWQGAGSQFVRADIEVAPGVQVNPTAGMEQGAFVGVANVNVLGFAFGFAEPFYNVPAVMTVDNSAGTDCPADTVACYRGVTDQLILDGHNWNWVTQDPSGGYTLTIGEFYNDLTGEDAGLSKINEFSLCENVGAVGGSVYPDDCGSSTDAWLQKNGSRSVASPIGPGSPACANGNGIYTVTATNRDGQTTDPVSVCVEWVQLNIRTRP